MPDLPPDDAYGRVTNPERFQPLWIAGERLVDRLRTGYAVTTDEGLNLDPDLIAGLAGEVVRVVRLAPTAGGGAGLVVAFTGFPGLRLRLGIWHIESFPACGCDACDERVEDLVAELEEKVEAVVSGHFEEAVTLLPQPGVSHSFGNESGWSLLPLAEARRLGAPKRIHWPPWTRVG